MGESSWREICGEWEREREGEREWDEDGRMPGRVRWEAIDLRRDLAWSWRRDIVGDEGEGEVS